MTAKITTKSSASAFSPASELTSIYTDRWVENLSELLESYKKWNGSEIKSVEVMEE